MKKNGFTLAEVLITIGVIGVLSAVVLPTFVKNNQNQVFANSLPAAVTDFENAISAMMIKEDAGNVFETEAWMDDNEFVNKLKEVLRVKRTLTSVNSYYPNKLTVVDGSTKYDASTIFNTVTTFEVKNKFAYHIRKNALADETKDEIEVMADGVNLAKAAAWVFIDVNGAEEPNRVGRDIYGFLLGSDGIMYALGGRDAAYRLENDASKIWSNANSSFVCTNSAKGSYALGCTARLISDKYQIKY